jgi:DNA-binding CsgD family transcriptional regulator
VPELTDYDELLTEIYEPALGSGDAARMLRAICRYFGAISAGFSVYDQAGERIRHSLFTGMTGDPEPGWEMLQEIIRDPAALMLTRRRLDLPHRLTDAIPGPRLRSMSWYRGQVALGVGGGLLQDLDVDGTRVRLFIMRQMEQADFSAQQLDMMALVSRHLVRALRQDPSRLLASEGSAGTVTLFHGTTESAKPTRHAHSLQTHLRSAFELTPTEARVAVALSEGKTRLAVAELLGISINTIKTHVRRLYPKLGVTRHGELVRQMNDIRVSRRRWKQ